MLKLFALFATCFSLVLHPSFATAQVNGPGPSDPALFDTVINLPPDPSIGSSERVGGTTGQTNQLNVMDGGGVGRDFDADSGSEVNISGGTVGVNFNANSGSEVNLSGGTLDFLFAANPGSEVNISGGTVGNGFEARAGSVVGLFGGEFKLNGASYTEPAITLSGGDLFSGTLSDGSAFIFSSASSDALVGVTLTPTALPTLDTAPVVVNTAFPTRPSGLRAGQKLTLQGGGELGNHFEAVDSTLDIEGGFLGAGAGAVRSVVNISGGAVGFSFDANSGSVVNISGGAVGFSFDANSGSEVNISGGTVGNDFNANSGSKVNISGGSVDINFDANSGSEVNISGGAVGGSFRASSGSEVNISGGGVGVGFDADSGSEVNISGGVVGSSFRANSGSEVNISGGSVGSSFRAHPGSVVNISGGTIGDFFGAISGSEVNISGGTVGSSFRASSGSEVNLHGTDFMLDGVPLDGLATGEAFTITERDVTLSGLLVDGTPFEFGLNTTFITGGDLFEATSKLTVTLVPEPSSLLLGALASTGLLMRRHRQDHFRCLTPTGRHCWLRPAVRSGYRYPLPDKPDRGT